MGSKLHVYNKPLKFPQAGSKACYCKCENEDSVFWDILEYLNQVNKVPSFNCLII